MMPHAGTPWSVRRAAITAPAGQAGLGDVGVIDSGVIIAFGSHGLWLGFLLIHYTACKILLSNNPSRYPKMSHHDDLCVNLQISGKRGYRAPVAVQCQVWAHTCFQRRVSLASAPVVEARSRLHLTAATVKNGSPAVTAARRIGGAYVQPSAQQTSEWKRS